MYYKKTIISDLEIGDQFMYQNTLFELIYNQHAVNVGLTVEKFKPQGNQEGEATQQILSFADDAEVLTLITTLNENI